MSKIYIEVGAWGFTFGRLNHLSGEPFGVSLWHITDHEDGLYQSRLSYEKDWVWFE